MNFLIRYKNGKERVISEAQYSGELRRFSLIEDIRTMGEVV